MKIILSALFAVGLVGFYFHTHSAQAANFSSFGDGTKVETVTAPDLNAFVIQIKQSNGKICYAAFGNANSAAITCLK